MKKSLIKVTVALGIVLGGLIPFSFVPGVDSDAIACSDKEKSSEPADRGGPDSR